MLLGSGLCVPEPDNRGGRLRGFALRLGMDEMITTCCDHIAEDDGMVFCDIGRRVPTECRQMCAAFITDQDPTPQREATWSWHVAGGVDTSTGSTMKRGMAREAHDE